MQSYVPRSQEQGTHVLKLLRSNQHVRGSPFEFNVTERVAGGHDKVVAYGPGLTNVTVNEEGIFPTKAPISFAASSSTNEWNRVKEES